MSKNIRIVSIGDLVIDYYYVNNKIYGVSGGMSSHNIIANLASKGFKTCAFGVCGNDQLGIITKKSLEAQTIDSTHILTLNNIKTRSVHINCIKNKIKHEIISELECPICHKINWYPNSMLDVEYVLNNIQKEDILIFDSINEKNKEIIKSTQNLKLIDIGHIDEFKNITINELKENYNKKFEIININENVYKHILKKYNLKTYKDFNNIFNAKLIIITKGKIGANFIYNNKLFEFKLEKISKEIEPTGAGDAFFASIISDFINNKLQIEETNFEKWFKNATKITKKVVKQIGARSHIQNLYKIKNVDSQCICENFYLDNNK